MKPMSFVEYQVAAARTANHDAARDTREKRLANFALGAAGEAGEVADIVKKHLFHDKPLDRDHLAKEIGDCLWYLAMLADSEGMDLGEIAQMNLDKLRARYPAGFNTADANARKDEAQLTESERVAVITCAPPEGGD